MRKNKNNQSKKQSMWFWGGLVGLIILGGCAYVYYTLPPATLNATPTPAIIAQGKNVYTANCATCHSFNAIGQNPKKPKGGTQSNGVYLAPALNGTGHTWHHPNEMLFNIIKNGSMANDSPMVGFKDRLSDEEMIAVLHYIKSLWPEQIRMRHSMMK